MYLTVQKQLLDINYGSTTYDTIVKIKNYEKKQTCMRHEIKILLIYYTKTNFNEFGTLRLGKNIINSKDLGN